MAPIKTKVDSCLVEQLCNITDVSRLVATNLLEACNNNLELAINMHMEDGSSAVNGDMNNEDDVRAPIPQKQEILIEGPDPITFSLQNRTRVTMSVFDKFRDFQAEGKRQEEHLLAGGSRPGTSRSTKQKMKTLEDLFRPPLDLMFRGNFQSARDTGNASKKWLLVNVQNSSEFACQVLNRDVWSNCAVKSIIREHFIFWQVYFDSEEGLRYTTFYPVNDWPYVAIVDPRTGECMISWKKLDAVSFCDIITEFLSSRPSLDDCGGGGGTNSPRMKKPKMFDQNLLEADEAAQFEAAIKASLESETIEEESDDVETFDPEPQEEVIALTPPSVDTSFTETEASPSPSVGARSWEQYLGKDTDPTSKLILRLPDGSRDSIDMPCSSTLMALVLYVASKGFSNESYEMVTNFPKKRLSYLDFQASLKSVGLFPQETVFIQKR